MAILLRMPVLAKCDNRFIFPKKHPERAHPDEWWGEKTATIFRYTTFDFFIDWSSTPNCVFDEIWLKRIVEAASHPIDENSVMDAIIKCDGNDFFNNAISFSEYYGFNLNYILFRERDDWGLGNGKILKASFSGANINSLEFVSINSLKNQIKSLSGGAIKLGKKGLIFGTSALECYLSSTDAVWPGDADLIPLKENGSAIAIIEFKKHNLQSPIHQESFNKYYPYPDGRKYDRLAYLSQRLSSHKYCPLIIVHFPTLKEQTEVYVEKLNGIPGNLKIVENECIKMPYRGDYEMYNSAIRKIIDIVEKN